MYHTLAACHAEAIQAFVAVVFYMCAYMGQLRRWPHGQAGKASKTRLCEKKGDKAGFNTQLPVAGRSASRTRVSVPGHSCKVLLFGALNKGPTRPWVLNKGP